MSSYIIYKLKNSNVIKTLNFEGTYITKLEASNSIKNKENFIYDDLLIKEFEGHEYLDDKDKIPKFTTIEVSRIPKANRKRIPKTTNIEFNNESKYKYIANQSKQMEVIPEKPSATDDEKITHLTESEWNKLPNIMQRPAVPPAGYACRKCNMPGHYIERCPGIKDEFGKYVERKKYNLPSGIPRTRLEKAAPEEAGVFLDSTGNYVKFAKGAVNLQIIPQKVPFSKEENPEYVDKKIIIPPEFSCNICNNLISNASETPCCKKSYCYQCIANKLFDPDTGTNGLCPSCTTAIPLIKMLIENRNLNEKISAWRNLSKEVKTVEDGKQTEDSSDHENLNIETNDPNFCLKPLNPNRIPYKPRLNRGVKVTPLPVEQYKLEDFNSEEIVYKNLEKYVHLDNIDEKGEVDQKSQTLNEKYEPENDPLNYLYKPTSCRTPSSETKKTCESNKHDEKIKTRENSRPCYSQRSKELFTNPKAFKRKIQQENERKKEQLKSKEEYNQKQPQSQSKQKRGYHFENDDNQQTKKRDVRDNERKSQNKENVQKKDNRNYQSRDKVDYRDDRSGNDKNYQSQEKVDYRDDRNYQSRDKVDYRDDRNYQSQDKVDYRDDRRGNDRNYQSRDKIDYRDDRRGNDRNYQSRDKVDYRDDRRGNDRNYQSRDKVDYRDNRRENDRNYQSRDKVDYRDDRRENDRNYQSRDKVQYQEDKRNVTNKTRERTNDSRMDFIPSREQCDQNYTKERYPRKNTRK